MKLNAGVCGWAFVFLLLPLISSAHATPISTTPAASATETETPASISIRFTERIEVGASSLTVFAPNGEEVQEGKGDLDPQDQRVLTVPIREAGEGVYTVSWQVVSVDDGHFTRGGYSFLVDASGKAFEGGEGKVEIAYSSHLSDALSSFFNLVGESLLLALYAFLLWVFLARKHDIGQISMPILLPIGFFAALLFVAGSTVNILRKSAELSSLQDTAFIDAFQIYLSSSSGTFSALKLGAALVFFVFFALSYRSVLKGKAMHALAAMGVLLGGILCMQAYVSHATASLFHPHLSVLVTLLHLFAKELAVGAVCLLCVAYLFCIQRRSLLHFPYLTAVLDATIGWALILAGTTGAYITWLHLKSFDNLFLTQWGAFFIYLLTATALFGFFRLLHQFLIFPRIREVVYQKVLLFTLPLEVVLALCVLFFSGYISMTTPPFTVEAFDYKETIQSESLSFTVDVHPYEHEAMRIMVRDEDGKTVDPKALTVMVTNTTLDIGPNVVPLQKRFEGGYVFPRHELSPSGVWDVTIIARQEGAYDAHANFLLDYPGEIYASKRSDGVRNFDQFALLCVITACGILLFASALLLHGLFRMKKEALNVEGVNVVHDPWRFFASGILGAAALCALAYTLQGIVFASEFKRQCTADGHTWEQSFPTREFMQTSPNALLGCTVHDGHYHFVEEREYEYFESQQ
jgi:methionine-rich copper-binding protein CopC/nitrogen fixation protein FixH